MTVLNEVLSIHLSNQTSKHRVAKLQLARHTKTAKVIIVLKSRLLLKLVGTS